MESKGSAGTANNTTSWKKFHHTMAKVHDASEPVEDKVRAKTSPRQRGKWPTVLVDVVPGSGGGPTGTMVVTGGLREVVSGKGDVWETPARDQHDQKKENDSKSETFSKRRKRKSVHSSHRLSRWFT